MSGRVFTDYVRSVGRYGEPPDQESFERVWRMLEVALRSELRRRGLWQSPPRFVGVVGSERWDHNALEELTAEAYAFNFVDRLRSLRAQLEVKPNIEGLVFLNLKNFLHERQRRHDPIGYRLFATVRTAIREAAEAGELLVVSGDPDVRNDTVVQFAGRPPEPHEAVATRGSAGLPAEIAGHWADALLPELVTARGRELGEVAARLRRRFAELPAAGIDRLTVKELVDPLKEGALKRWRALHLGPAGREPETGEGFPEPDEGFGEVRRAYRPDRIVEDEEAFQKLIRCVERGLRTQERAEATVEYLQDLWEFLKIHAANVEDLPSRRKLAELLGIPRNRFPELYEILGGLITRCRALLNEAPARRRGRTP